MGFFRGIGKLTGVIATTVGVLGTITGATVLGVSANMTYTTKQFIGGTATYGVGCSNWGKVTKVTDPSGTSINPSKEQKNWDNFLALNHIDSYHSFATKFGHNINDKGADIFDEKPVSLSHAISQSYAMYVSGIVLLVLLGITWLVGIVLLVLTKKKQK